MTHLTARQIFRSKRWRDRNDRIAAHNARETKLALDLAQLDDRDLPDLEDWQLAFAALELERKRVFSAPLQRN